MTDKAKELREILIKLRQCVGYPKDCSTNCPEPEICKEIIDQAITAILNAGYIKKNEIGVDVERIAKIIQEYASYRYSKGKPLEAVYWQDFNDLSQAIAKAGKEER